MKKLGNALLVFLLFISAAAYAGAKMPGVEIVGKDKTSGRVVYQGKTDANGKFATGQLSPGAYTFEFRSNRTNQMSVALVGPKRTVEQSSIPGGMAVHLVIGPDAKLSGEVRGEQIARAAAQSNAKMKIINGKRYVWLPAEVGSNLPGRWMLEADAAAAAAASKVQRAEGRDLQILPGDTR